jgi:uncharacterized protein YdeI (YjbR/CyaY-like superfamily)
MRDLKQTADQFFLNARKWNSEMNMLRQIVLACGLTETIKWGQPVYVREGKNIVLINSFKDKCVLGFFKGALLKDKKGILVQQGENSQSARILSFTETKSIEKFETIIKAYVREAIEIEASGKTIEYKSVTDYQIPEEFEKRLNGSDKLKKAFNSLTPGRQRAYLMYFAGAKQSATRESRIDQYTKRILDGKGINDCICGLSKRMPGCDGSHKYAK